MPALKPEVNIIPLLFILQIMSVLQMFSCKCWYNHCLRDSLTYDLILEKISIFSSHCVYLFSSRKAQNVLIFGLKNIKKAVKKICILSLVHSRNTPVKLFIL